MPIKYRCKNCGFIIYEFKKVGQDFSGVPTPLEVIRITGGICPSCKKHLELPGVEDYKTYIILRPHITTSTKYSGPALTITRGVQVGEVKAQ